MTDKGVRDDHSIQVAARNVLRGGAPERDADLDDMWRGTSLRLADDQGGLQIGQLQRPKT